MSPGVNFINVFCAAFFARGAQKRKKDSEVVNLLRFWELHALKLYIERWWNWAQVSEFYSSNWKQSNYLVYWKFIKLTDFNFEVKKCILHLFYQTFHKNDSHTISWIKLGPDKVISLINNSLQGIKKVLTSIFVLKHFVFMRCSNGQIHSKI